MEEKANAWYTGATLFPFSITAAKKKKIQKWSAIHEVLYIKVFQFASEVFHMSLESKF